MRSISSLVAALAGLVISVSTSVSFAQFVPSRDSAETKTLKASVFIRLDAQTPNYDDATDRGAVRTVEALATFMRSFDLQISRGKIDDAKQSMSDLFSLLPASNGGFVAILTPKPRNAPVLVAAVRDAIARAGELAADSPTLRILFLEKVGTVMESHVDLAFQHGPAYLQLLTKWTNPVLGWRYLANDPRTHSTTRENLLAFARSLSTEERARIAEHDALYTRGFQTMVMCPRLFTTVK